jgi:hypothetical protein
MILRQIQLKYLLVLTVLIVLGILIRGIFFEKIFSIAIANETDLKVPDLVIKIDNQIVFSDSIFQNSIPCCWTKQELKFGFYKIDVESKSINLKREFSVFSFKNSHIYIGIFGADKNKFSIVKRVYYFFRPLYA